MYYTENRQNFLLHKILRFYTKIWDYCKVDRDRAGSYLHFFPLPAWKMSCNQLGGYPLVLVHLNDEKDVCEVETEWTCGDDSLVDWRNPHS